MGVRIKAGKDQCPAIARFPSLLQLKGPPGERVAVTLNTLEALVITQNELPKDLDLCFVS